MIVQEQINTISVLVEILTLLQLACLYVEIMFELEVKHAMTGITIILLIVRAIVLDQRLDILAQEISDNLQLVAPIVEID